MHGRWLQQQQRAADETGKAPSSLAFEARSTFIYLKRPQVDQGVLERVPPVALVEVPREFLAPPRARGLRLEEPHESRVPRAGGRDVPAKDLVQHNSETHFKGWAGEGISILIFLHMTSLSLPFNTNEELPERAPPKTSRPG